MINFQLRDKMQQPRVGGASPSRKTNFEGGDINDDDIQDPEQSYVDMDEESKKEDDPTEMQKVKSSKLVGQLSGEVGEPEGDKADKIETANDAYGELVKRLKSAEG
jgi:hypothetical protein